MTCNDELYEDTIYYLNKIAKQEKSILFRVLHSDRARKNGQTYIRSIQRLAEKYKPSPTQDKLVNKTTGLELVKESQLQALYETYHVGMGHFKIGKIWKTVKGVFEGTGLRKQLEDKIALCEHALFLLCFLCV